MFSNTVENLVLDGTQEHRTSPSATSAKVTAADNTLPVWKITATGKLTIIGPDSVGGTVGWLVETNGADAQGRPRLQREPERASGSRAPATASRSTRSRAAPSASRSTAAPTTSAAARSPATAPASWSQAAATPCPARRSQSNTGDGVLVSGNNNTIKGVSATLERRRRLQGHRDRQPVRLEQGLQEHRQRLRDDGHGDRHQVQEQLEQHRQLRRARTRTPASSTSSARWPPTRVATRRTTCPSRPRPSAPTSSTSTGPSGDNDRWPHLRPSHCEFGRSSD